jgi:hypothetical protein
MLISASVILIIGILQFFGYDIFGSDFFRTLLNMKPNARNPYDFVLFVKEYVSYGTLYNSNHFSLYISLIFPTALAFYSMQLKPKGKILGIILVFLCVLSFIGCNVSGGYLAAIATIVLLLFLAFPYIKKNMKNMIILIVSVICLLVAANFISGGRVFVNLKLSSITNEEDRLEISYNKIYIDNIVLGYSDIFIDTREYDLAIENEDNYIRVYDEAGNELETEISLNEKPGVRYKYIYKFTDEKYSSYSVMASSDYSIVTVFAGSSVMDFHMTDQGVMVPGMNNMLDIIREVERNPLLYKMPTIFSGRGYIWSGMLPLLRDTVLIGNGPDTTFLTYPQHDFIGKVNMGSTFRVVIEKPHCYYIQIAHDTGWISLFLLFALFAYYIVDTFIVLFKFKPHGLNKTYSLSVLCGVIAYLFASIMYDSSVLTAPVFWTVIAIGFVLNRINRKTSGVSFG